MSNFNNNQKVIKWYEGIQTIFQNIQKRNKWSQQEAWSKLEIELRKSVSPEMFVPDDLEWVKDIILKQKIPTTDEAIRVSQRYTDSTPLLDALSKLL